jgi:hypothetical protein
MPQLVSQHQPRCVTDLTRLPMSAMRPPRFFFGGVNRRLGMFSLCGGRTVRPPTLPVAPCHAPPLSRESNDTEPRTLSVGHAPTHPLSGFRVPSTDRSLPPRSLLALGTRLGGRHWSLGLAAAVQRPTRVHTHRCALGLGADPVIHRRLPGHVPPIDFYSCVDFRARPSKNQTRSL